MIVCRIQEGKTKEITKALLSFANGSVSPSRKGKNSEIAGVFNGSGDLANRRVGGDG